MKSLLAIVVIVSLMAAGAEERRPKSLLIMWDGMRADAVANVSLPNVRKLMDGTWQPGYRGAWSLCGKPIHDARPYSFANHAAIMMGVTCAKHGVTFNHRTDKCRIKEWPCYLTRLMNARPGLRTEYIYACGGADWAYCADERVAHRDYGLDDEAKVRHYVDVYSGTNAPDAAVMFVENPDASGHKDGYYPMGAKYRQALVDNDAGLGKVLAAIAARPTFKDEDWLIALTADHGGYGCQHGRWDTHSMTIPVVLASRHVVPGEMAGLPHNYDLAPTVLRHHGVETAGMGLDGIAIGDRPTTWSVPKRLEDGLFSYFSFRNQIANDVPGGPEMVLGGDEFWPTPGSPKHLNGKPYIVMNGDDTGGAYAFLTDTEEMFITPHPVFSITFWEYGWPSGEDPLVMGNKDLSRPGSAGFAIHQSWRMEHSKRGLAVTYGRPDGKDGEIGVFDRDPTPTWTFYALVFAPEDQIWFCQGRSNGDFHWVCAKADRPILGSGLPLHLCQDGTGKWKSYYAGGLDDIAIWKRPLKIVELERIFREGLKGRALHCLMTAK